MKAFELKKFASFHKLFSEVVALEYGENWAYSGAEIPAKKLPEGMNAMENAVAEAYAKHGTMENIVNAEPETEAILDFIRFLLEPIWVEPAEVLKEMGWKVSPGHNFVVRAIC